MPSDSYMYVTSLRQKGFFVYIGFNYTFANGIASESIITSRLKLIPVDYITS